MKIIRKTDAAILLLVIIVSGLWTCSYRDQKLDLFVPSTDSDKDLVSVKSDIAPVIDGDIDAIWSNSPKLITKTIVNDPGDNVFRGYVGNSYNITVRSMYDASNIYILVQWDDKSLSINRNPWYFDVATSRWMQEKGVPIFDAGGTKTRDAFYEDKLAFLWNINKSVPDWSVKTCFSSCHVGVGAANGYARHYTKGPSERIDMWHWKLIRDGFWGIMDDQYQDNTQPNGRKSDDKLSGSYSDNIQTLVITGASTSVSVPKYIIPNRDFHYWITQAEITNGTAKLVTAVSSMGVLTYSGGTIDPLNATNGIDYQRNGNTTGKKAIPSIVTEKVTGSRGDITARHQHSTATGWTLEIVRKLKTGDLVNQDIDFSSLEDQPFGIGIFDNAQIAHSVKVGLTLKFKK